VTKIRDLRRIADDMAAETIAALQADRDRIAGENARLRALVNPDKFTLETAIEVLKAENVRLVREHALLAFKLGPLLVAAGAAYDYFSDKTDADLIDGTFHGNREASLASELAEAIRRAKGETSW
jgi:hypothetical protein